MKVLQEACEVVPEVLQVTLVISERSGGGAGKGRALCCAVSAKLRKQGH